MAKKDRSKQREFNEPETTGPKPEDIPGGEGLARKGARIIVEAKKKRKAILDSL